MSWLIRRSGEDFWLAWWFPGALDRPARTVGWTAERGRAKRFDTRDEAQAVMVGLVPSGFSCEVVEDDAKGAPDGEHGGGGDG